jgi:hypothetical protein
MSRLRGTQRYVLEAIQEAQGESSAFIEDARIAQSTQIALRVVRDCFLTLDKDEYVDLARTEGGLKASITAEGRLILDLYRPFPTQPAPSPPEPVRSRSRTGRERALVIGISDYPPPIPRLPAVANDGREIAKLLKSSSGQFPDQNVTELIDQAAKKDAVLRELETTFSNVQAEDAVFAYLAGHGTVVGDDYFYVAHDTMPDQLATTGVPLKRIKELFDGSPSQRAFLWLDFCHSGGILARDLEGQPDDREVIKRTLKVSKGQGKLILTACTSSQSSYESAALGHGFFTNALLRGLRGEAATAGEVTINSLFEFIDRQMGSDRQRPMMFGEMIGRVVLMHVA